MFSLLKVPEIVMSTVIAARTRFQIEIERRFNLHRIGKRDFAAVDTVAVAETLECRLDWRPECPAEPDVPGCRASGD